MLPDLTHVHKYTLITLYLCCVSVHCVFHNEIVYEIFSVLSLLELSNEYSMKVVLEVAPDNRYK